MRIAREIDIINVVQIMIRMTISHTAGSTLSMTKLWMPEVLLRSKSL